MGHYLGCQVLGCGGNWYQRKGNEPITDFLVEVTRESLFIGRASKPKLSTNALIELYPCNKSSLNGKTRRNQSVPPQG
jgi:hypothetical protein